MEEYSVAAHILKLPQSSLCELARNSVIQSGFEMEIKRHWLGQKWYFPGAAGNDINKASVSLFKDRHPRQRICILRTGSLDQRAKWEAEIQTRNAPGGTRAHRRDSGSELMPRRMFPSYREPEQRPTLSYV